MRLDRKAFGRVATTFVATAMLAAFAAVPAMAEGEQTWYNVNGYDSISIDKVLEKPLNVYAPNTKFEFSVAPSGDGVNEGQAIAGEFASGQKSDGTEVSDLQVYKGVTDGVKTNDTYKGEAIFAPAETDLTKNSLTQQFTFAVDPSAFTHAGVYKYKVTETVGSYDGVTYDQNTRDLYVYVENVENPAQGQPAYKVVGAVVKGAQNGKTDRFTNKYMNGNTDPDTNELYIEKDVEGVLGNKSEEFAFTINITSNKPTDGSATTVTEKYYAVVETPKADNTTAAPDGDWDVVDGATGTTKGVITLQTGENHFVLKDNQRLHIYGLSENDEYTIVETAAGQNGYTTSVDAGTGNTPSTDNKTVTGNVDPDGSIQNIVYTNRRDSVTPTGVLLNVAPYALMVIIAAAGCFVFLRKRRDD